MISDIHQGLPGTIRIGNAFPGDYPVMSSLPFNHFASPSRRPRR
ncbi:MAG: hypothetical protein ACQEUH_12745 [Pseudomonadota bacterium]